ncbi:hypothetical protein [Dysgonomonas sp. Marseille-P4361]|uniref:hypothetical protein n=1 Tax=Dysgonomonas sp. Marseille-P4361 TaxID=2161820 RepID=UPI000D55CF09|nr:hypothetical protein [Dysgonomonas sp. Marseille-P4361]
MTEKETLISKLSDLEKFALIGYIYTNDRLNAYLASRGKKLTANKSSLNVQSSRWINSPDVQAFLDVERARRFTAIEQSTAESDTRSKDDVIRELNLLANQETEPRRKSEILMKLADLQQMKKQDEETEESKVSFYRPLKCSECVLYQKAKNELNKKK